MRVKIPVDLTTEEQATLQTQANAEGVSLDDLLRRAVLRMIAIVPEIESEQLSPEQWEAELNEWLDNIPEVPTLSDSAISRESIYTREDEWR